MKIAYLDVIYLSFLRQWSRHTVYETIGHLVLKSNQNEVETACLQTRPEQPGLGGIWKIDGRVEEQEGGRKARRRTLDRGKRGSEAGRRKEQKE